MADFLTTIESIKEIFLLNKYGHFTGIGTNLIIFALGLWIGNKHGKNIIIKKYINKEMLIDYSKYTSLSIGASGAVYKAPNNGAFKLTTEGPADIYIDGVIIQTITSGTASIKILKGQTFSFKYKGSIKELLFYYEKAQ